MPTLLEVQTAMRRDLLDDGDAAVADDPNAAAWLAAHLAAGHFSDFALSDAENPSFAAEHAQ